MKPETLRTLQIELRTIPDSSLDEFFIAVLSEIRRRKPNRNRLQKPHESPWRKDCEPIRGF
jgi:hypothetical protein